MQFQDLVNQSFNTFNIYGKQPEAVADIIQMFLQVLEDEKIEDITAAFKKWAFDNSVMPTPAEIRKMCVEIRSSRSNRMPSSDDYPKPKWSQIVYDRTTNEIIAVFQHGQHLSPYELSLRFPGVLLRDSMKRESL